MKIIFVEGDLVVSDYLKKSKGMPYIIKVHDISNDIITYIHKGEMHYISIYFVRKSNSIDRIFGFFYDMIFK